MFIFLIIAYIAGLLTKDVHEKIRLDIAFWALAILLAVTANA